MKIPEDVIEQIRSQVNIVDVVSQYVQLKQSGKNLFGLCPFHEDGPHRFPSPKINKFFIVSVVVVGATFLSSSWKLRTYHFQKRLKRLPRWNI
ncbi:CHC2 zinc finger domain protein [Lentilactobacillus parafarraginis F0439]|uniref:CHC2 zinc finger domain protein n=1 Tax=Lentilactobacillus parafarraginis F0439 TaxID=797515 RepID=G9ZSG6_9LACO|nr:CHC2 zinc finger domain protein [Lentilactobacillus parafarraginis F0439]